MKIKQATKSFFRPFLLTALRMFLPARAQNSELIMEIGKSFGSDAVSLRSDNSFSDNFGTNSEANSQVIPESIVSLLGVIGMTLLLRRRRAC
jgi:hypothetical protein